MEKLEYHVIKDYTVVCICTCEKTFSIGCAFKHQNEIFNLNIGKDIAYKRAIGLIPPSKRTPNKDVKKEITDIIMNAQVGHFIPLALLSTVKKSLPNITKNAFIETEII